MNAPGTIGAPAKKGGVKKIIILVLLISVGVHVAAGVIAGIIVVARYFAAPPAEFKAARDVRLPAKKREQRMSMAAFDAAAPKPTFSDRMQSTRPTAFSLPEVPAMPVDQILPMDASSIITDQVASVADTQGLGATSGALAGGSGGFGGKGLSFLGVDSTGQRILLVFDVSTSVKNKAEKAGVSFSKIREEIIALLKKLPITARFGIVQFSRLFMSFSDELVPASNPNRDAATLWINEKWVETGSIPKSRAKNDVGGGLTGVLEFAKELKPDVVYIVSDGSFQSNQHPGGIPWNEVKKAVEELKDANGKPSQVNFIAFEPKPEDLKELKNTANRARGKVNEMK